MTKAEEVVDKTLSSVLKFDEFYKDNKNIEHEAYYYKKPRIDRLLYQADLAGVNFRNFRNSRVLDPVNRNSENENPNELPLKEEDLNMSTPERRIANTQSRTVGGQAGKLTNSRFSDF